VTFEPEYFRLSEGQPFPDLGGYAPFAAVIVIDDLFPGEWRERACDWIVEAGCLYAMAWGKDCEEWHDLIDWAVLGRFGYGHIPDDRFVMTTWHAHEPLGEVFWFARHAASHPDVALRNLLILHVATTPGRDRLLHLFAASMT
jgi:hypothetical protein